MPVVLLMAVFCGCGNGPRESGTGDHYRADALTRTRDLRAEARDRSRKEWPRFDLQHLKVLGDTIDFGWVEGIEYFDDLLVVADQIADPHIKVVDRGSGQVVRKFGRRGEGPGEFRTPVSVVAVADDPPEVEVFDFANRRITRIRLDPDSYEPEIVQEIPLVFEGHIRKFVRLDGEYLGSGIFYDYTLVRLDGDGRQIGRLAADPPFVEVGHSHQAILNTSFVARRPRRSQIALAYVHANRIDIVDWLAHSYLTTAGPRETQARFRVEGSVEGRLFSWEAGGTQAYVGLDASEEYIYALFCGCEFPDPGDITTPIHVFTWDGEFVAELEVGMVLDEIRVSADDSVLWGSYRDPYPQISAWRIPELGSVERSSARCGP